MTTPAGASVPLVNTNKSKDTINCNGHERGFHLHRIKDPFLLKHLLYILSKTNYTEMETHMATAKKII